MQRQQKRQQKRQRFTQRFTQLWLDESGFVVSSELVMAGTVLAVGMLVGMAALRDQVVGELHDLSAAFSQLDQSYSYSALQGPTSRTAGSQLEMELPAERPSDGAACINLDEEVSTESELTLET